MVVGIFSGEGKGGEQKSVSAWCESELVVAVGELVAGASGLRRHYVRRDRAALDMKVKTMLW